MEDNDFYNKTEGAGSQAQDGETPTGGRQYKLDDIFVPEGFGMDQAKFLAAVEKANLTPEQANILWNEAQNEGLAAYNAHIEERVKAVENEQNNAATQEAHLHQPDGTSDSVPLTMEAEEALARSKARENAKELRRELITLSNEIGKTITHEQYYKALARLEATEKFANGLVPASYDWEAEYIHGRDQRMKEQYNDAMLGESRSSQSREVRYPKEEVVPQNLGSSRPFTGDGRA